MTLEKTEIGLIIGNVVLGGLFFISEYLSRSKCKANGITDFLISDMPCLPGRVIRVYTPPPNEIVNENVNEKKFPSKPEAQYVYVREAV